MRGEKIRKLHKFFQEAKPLRQIGIYAPDKRPQMAKEVIVGISKQNAAAAAAFFIPGSDMPILTLNQMKMVIKLAAIYDQQISAQTAAELLTTLGSGYVFRGVARQLVEFIPGPGIAVKVGMAYSGTQALGKLAQKYFEARSVANKTGN